MAIRQRALNTFPVTIVILSPSEVTFGRQPTWRTYKNEVLCLQYLINTKLIISLKWGNNDLMGPLKLKMEV